MRPRARHSQRVGNKAVRPFSDWWSETVLWTEACRALGIVPELFDIPVNDNRAKVAAINEAFRRTVKRAHPDTGIVGEGGPSIAQCKEARALLVHMVSDECPACRGLTFIKSFGKTVKCPTCSGTGRVTP